MQRILTLLLPFPLTVHIGFGIFRLGTTAPSDIDVFRLTGLIAASLLAAIFAWNVFRKYFEGRTNFWAMLPISLLVVVSSVALSGPIIWIVEALGSGFDFEPTPIWVFPLFGILGIIPFLPMILGLHIGTFAIDALYRKIRARRPEESS